MENITHLQTDSDPALVSMKVLRVKYLSPNWVLTCQVDILFFFLQKTKQNSNKVEYLLFCYYHNEFFVFCNIYAYILEKNREAHYTVTYNRQEFML